MLSGSSVWMGACWKGVALKSRWCARLVVKKKAVEVQVSLLRGDFTGILAGGEVRSRKRGVFINGFVCSNSNRRVLVVVVS